MKNHSIIYVLIAIAIITAALIAMTYFFGITNPWENRGATTVPDPDAASDTYSYFTPNPTTSQENTENNASVQSDSTSKDAAETLQATYVVKTYNGIIGVFADDSDNPMQTIEVSVASLPESDQQALDNGISVKGTGNLRRLLEDYES